MRAEEDRAPLVTVLLPVFNAARFLHAAIESVLSGSFKNFELLIIDDGSTDGSLPIIQEFRDPRVRLVEHATNHGLVASLNEGIEQARGRYIARMDADDVMRADRLERQVAFMEANKDVAVVAAFVRFINEEDEVIGDWDIDRAADTEERIRSTMARTNCIAHPSVMIRISALGELRYSARATAAEDWDLWMRLLSRGARIAKITEPLLDYRVHPSSVMGSVKANAPLERRLLRTRHRYLVSEAGAFRINGFNLRVVRAQFRTLARHLRNNIFVPRARDLKRLFTYSPIAMLREQRRLRETLAAWKGEQLFLFPNVNAGGAEQVHVDIVAAVADRHPLIILSGFSTDRAFEHRFREQGAVLEIPRLLNHPFTRQRTVDVIATRVNALPKAVLFGSLSASFYDLLPLLSAHVRTAYLQHAFLFQPAGNHVHRAWLARFHRVGLFLFVARNALHEFEKLLLSAAVPRSRFDKLLFVPNAVHRFGEVVEHEPVGVLFVGRDSPEKRLPLFLKLASELHAIHNDRFRFTVVGSAPIAGYPFVTFRGLVNDPEEMARIYGQHDHLVLTSSREGFPMVILEAMANGLVVSAPPVGDVPLRLDRSFAFVASSVEPSMLVEEIRTFLEWSLLDPEEIGNMKRRALSIARAEFDPALFRQRYRALLISPASEA